MVNYRMGLRHRKGGKKVVRNRKRLKNSKGYIIEMVISIDVITNRKMFKIEKVINRNGKV
jgi:hypothetical protein